MSDLEWQPSPFLERLYEIRATQQIAEDAELCKQSLSHFIKSGWSAFKPEVSYVHNWHIDAVCEHLEAVTYEEIKRLQIWIPPGTSKPIDEDALILRGDGQRVPLRDISVGDQVITHTGRAGLVEAVHEQGSLATLRIETDCGRVVHAAPDHPFLTPIGWIRADELQVGTALANVSLPQIDSLRDRIPEEMRLIGYFIGDGNCTYGKCRTSKNQRNTLASRVTCLDPVQGADIIACAESLGFSASYSKAKGGAHTINISNGVRPWLQEIGLAGHGSWTKRVPSFVFSASSDLIAELVGAYFACDGTLTKRTAERRDLGITFTSVNRLLLEDIQHLLLRLGIQSRVRSHRQGGYKGDNYLSWRLSITSYDETAKFIARVPIVGVKADRLKRWSPQRGRFDETLIPDKVVSIESGGVRRCRCLTVATDHSFTAGDLVVKNSATVSVFWPAWEWSIYPWLRYWGASYETRFAARLASYSRDVMAGEWYQQRFGDSFKFVKDAEGFMSNDKGGSRLSTSPDSTGTGEHGHRILIDDPINAMDAEASTKTELNKANTWYDSQLSTRGLDIGYKHAKVVIMQRLHEEDLAAHALGDEEDEQDWTILCLPERFEKKHPYAWRRDPRDPDNPKTKGVKQGEGALLWPAQRDEKESNKLAKRLRPHRAAGQLQQRPAAKEGDKLKASWWRFYDPRVYEKGKWSELPIVPSSVVISVDCPLKDKETNDNIAIQVWAVSGLYRYLVDLELDKMNYSKAKRRVIEIATWARVTWPNARHVILIENTGYGTDLITDIKDKFTGIKKLNPQQEGDKEVRADRASEYLEDGYCFLPGFGPGWKNEPYDAAKSPAKINEFIDNCARFPNAAHDDDVDAWSQTMNWLRANVMRGLKTSSAAKRARTRTRTTATPARRRRRRTTRRG